MTRVRVMLKMMYSLKHEFYQNKEFGSIEELWEDVLASGMDPNHNITFNGIDTGECLWDLMEGTA